MLVAQRSSSRNVSLARSQIVAVDDMRGCSNSAIVCASHIKLLAASYQSASSDRIEVLCQGLNALPDDPAALRFLTGFPHIINVEL